MKSTAALLTAREAAELAAVPVSELAAQGGLGFRLGGRVVYRRVLIKAWRRQRASEATSR